ncbi:MAG: radical SAM protein [Oscillospiraceae bacterium]|nr:radical SAM protein [Oscillospiraceae bacterium]
MQSDRYPLRVLLWEATLRCNAYCEFCGSRCGDNEIRNELTREEICEAFRDIAENLNPGEVMINVTGGEPLLRKDLPEIMSYAQSLGFSWGLVSNGTLLNHEMADKLKKAGMKTLAVSIDGLESTHNSIRGVKNGFSRTIENLKAIHTEPYLESVMITTVVSKKNIGELEELKQFLLGVPFDIWRICPVDPIGRASGNDNLSLSKEELRWLFGWISEQRNENLPFAVTTSCSHYLGEFEMKTRDYPFNCGAGKTVGSILANGDIFVCPDVPKRPELIQGNVRTTPFSEAWKNRFEYFRNPFNRKIGDCSDCEYYSKCGGDSTHTWNFDENAPNFCPKKLGLVKEEKFSEREANLEEIIRSYKSDSSLFDITVKAQGRAEDCVVIEPEAADEILSFFEWGTGLRTDEKLCALYGSLFSNKDLPTGNMIAVIRKAIPMEAESDEKHLKIAEEILRKARSETTDKMQFLGFAHSHPNELTIAMSLGDWEFHKRLFEEDWRQALTVIINPQKKQIAAYTGIAADHSELHLLQHSKKFFS